MGNLSFDVTREELIEAFGAAGRVVDAKVPTDRETGRPRGFAFVEFESEDAARRCIEQLNGQRPEGSGAADQRGREPASAPGWRAPGWRILPTRWWGGFSRPGGGGFSRPGGGGFSRPGGGFRTAPAFPPPEEMNEGPGRRFQKKPDQKPARKTSPRRRRDDIPDDDDYTGR